VRLGKGDKDRVTVLPQSLREEVAKQIERARVIWSCKGLRPTRYGDREAGLAGVYMPGALARKFRRAAETFEWFWLFPARQLIGLTRLQHLRKFRMEDRGGGWQAPTVCPP
jgi:hypothetical protein